MGGRTVKFFLRLTRANMTINKLLGIAKAFDWSLAGLNNLTMSEEELMEAVRNARDLKQSPEDKISVGFFFPDVMSSIAWLSRSAAFRAASA